MEGDMFTFEETCISFKCDIVEEISSNIFSHKIMSNFLFIWLLQILLKYKSLIKCTMQRDLTNTS